MFRVPAATYRIQFNANFTFDDAKSIAAYLAALGITDIYASPILRARKGSSHGYDVVDAASLNPELGSDADFDALHDELKRLDLGFLLDVVPNHMAASPENAWWMSVLENGQHSRFLHYFDIDWSPVTAQGTTVTKVLLPILGRPYGEAVEAQEIQLGFDRDGFYFSYYEHRLPLAPESYRIVLRECVDSLPAEGVAIELRELVEGEESVPNSKFLKETIWRIYEQDADFRDALERAIRHFNGEPGLSESFNDLDALLDAQWYRLAYWRIASEKINYRRFFDVTDLVGVRVENPEVFEARNRRTLDLIAEGKVTGLRIDHIDGLYDPIGHMKKLQLRLGEVSAQCAVRSAQEDEDSLSAHRALRGAQEDEDSLSAHRALRSAQEDEDSLSAHRALRSAQEDEDSLSAHRALRTAHSFYIIVEKILTDDEELPRAFPVSGTTGYDFLSSVNNVFVDGEGLAQLDAFYRAFTGIRQSFADVAYERKKQVIHELFSGEMRALGEQLGSLAMLDRNARDFAPSELAAALTEVTACLEVYRTYIRDFDVSDADRRTITSALICARKRAGAAVDQRMFAFLERTLLVDPPRDNCLAFVMRWQQFTGRVMAKGVEDTAFYNYNRLVSLNEVGGEPGRGSDRDGLAEFHRRNERIARDWPDTLNATSTHDTKRSEDVRARINVLSEIPDVWAAAVRRWSKMNGGLVNPNVELLIYQNLIGAWPIEADRFKRFLEKAAREAKTHTSWISPNVEYESSLLGFADALFENEEFRASFERLQRKVAFYGFLNALSQLVLKITAPGVPDFYQGTELWDFSLVDPDNRRPVDYEQRKSLLKKVRSADPRTLLRRWSDGRIKMFVTLKALEASGQFAHSDYRPLDAGPNVCAFQRGDDAIVAVPRLITRLVDAGTLPIGDVWGDATLNIAGSWRNAFTGQTVEGDALALRDVFATFPVAILRRCRA
jgi:(1->4)-alpha-D-glucan 1-alpha-D-glucosylmutase